MLVLDETGSRPVERHVRPVADFALWSVELLEAALELRDLDEPGAIEVDRREDVVAELLELGVVREVLVHFRRGARRLDEPHPAVEQHFDIVPHGARPNA